MIHIVTITITKTVYTLRHIRATSFSISDRPNRNSAKKLRLSELKQYE